jgi:hypothetical protein
MALHEGSDLEQQRVAGKLAQVGVDQLQGARGITRDDLFRSGDMLLLTPGTTCGQGDCLPHRGVGFVDSALGPDSHREGGVGQREFVVGLNRTAEVLLGAHVDRQHPIDAVDVVFNGRCRTGAQGQPVSIS